MAEARRHHELVSALLERYENVWLEGLLALDRSVVAVLLGDVDAALTFAELALDHSLKSGHSHTRAAAHINLSHILERRGDFSAARKHLGKASEIVGANCHLRRAICDSWANLLLTSGDYNGCARFLDEAAYRAAQETTARPHWDVMTELFSRARLAQAQGSWTEAVEELTAALSIAVSANDCVWKRRLLTTRAKCKAKLGDQSALSDLMMATGNLNDPQSLPEHDAMVAAFTLKVNPVAAGVYYCRASRVAAAAGNSGLLQDIDRGIRDVVSGVRIRLALIRHARRRRRASRTGRPPPYPRRRGRRPPRRAPAAPRGSRWSRPALPAAASSTPSAGRPAQAAAAAAAPTERIEHLPLGTRTRRNLAAGRRAGPGTGALLHVRGDPEAARHRGLARRLPPRREAARRALAGRRARRRHRLHLGLRADVRDPDDGAAHRRGRRCRC